MDDYTPCARTTKSGETCHAGPRGGPAEGAEIVDGFWYCERHKAAAKAVSTKRRNLGHGICSAPGAGASQSNRAVGVSNAEPELVLSVQVRRML